MNKNKASSESTDLDAEPNKQKITLKLGSMAPPPPSQENYIGQLNLQQSQELTNDTNSEEAGSETFDKENKITQSYRPSAPPFSMTREISPESQGLDQAIVKYTEQITQESKIEKKEETEMSRDFSSEQPTSPTSHAKRTTDKYQQYQRPGIHKTFLSPKIEKTIRFQAKQKPGLDDQQSSFYKDTPSVRVPGVGNKTIRPGELFVSDKKNPSPAYQQEMFKKDEEKDTKPSAPKAIKQAKYKTENKKGFFSNLAEFLLNHLK